MLKRSRLTLEQFEKYNNVPGELSKVLSYEVPRGLYLIILHEPARMKITAKELKSGVSVDSSPVTITLSHTPASSSAVKHQAIAQIGPNVYTPVSINSTQKQITFEGPTGVTGDMLIYYAIGEGAYQWVVEVPSGSSTKRVTIEAGSLSQLNSRNLYDSASLIILPDGIIASEMELQLYVQTDAQIDMNNEIAVIDIPVVFADEEGLLEIGLTPDVVEAAYRG